MTIEFRPLEYTISTNKTFYLYIDGNKTNYGYDSHSDGHLYCFNNESFDESCKIQFHVPHNLDKSLFLYDMIHYVLSK